jgi:thioredoxin reductase/Pyruvate/2-oxoacid:ferredoxin oxidoreductase delta subunit
MSWVLLAGLVLALGLALAMAAARRTQLARMAARVHEREQSLSSGAREAVLQEPVVDLSRCLGCGTCVKACPEEGVLALVHGQALVVNAARCVGHRACERECPVGAIQVGIAQLATRRDVPNVSEALEALGTPGLFLAGEVTAHALIKTAIEHGTAVAAEVARRGKSGEPDELDLCIVGVGPAGLACALEAKRQGLRFLALDQELELGGTVAKYPRKKLVVMQPVELPLHGKLDQREYSKEELVELWQRIVVEQELPLRLGETFVGVERVGEGFVVRTERASFRARQVCLAIGRRGTPRRLGVAGEQLSKVAYSLLDAHGFQRRRVLVVGGGDSAVEAALALAEQPDNEVTLSYRRESFFRLRARNEQRLRESVGARRLAVLMASDVREVREEAVELEVREHGERRHVTLPNDDVLVMAGGTTPFELLSRVGVSFDPAQRPAPAPFLETGPGLVPALAGAFVLSLVGLVFALWHADYYLLPTNLRPEQLKHELLRPGRNLGLTLGIGACLWIGVNLLYLARRKFLPGFRWGSLRGWMSVHVGTGVLAFLCALLHAAMAPRDTVGGHALWGLAVLLVTGAVGRYFYAWIPRAANGRELAVEELRLRLGRLAEQWDRSHWSFVESVRRELAAHIDATQWRSSFLARVTAVVKGRREFESVLQRLVLEGRRDGVPEPRMAETLELARVAWRTALAAAHCEDLRAVVESWRYLHRWVAVLVVVLITLHVLYVLAYGSSSIGSFGG